MMRSLLILLFLLAGVAACDVENSVKSSPFPEYRVTGGESWVVGENKYQVLETAIILLPNSEPFLAVKVISETSVGPDNKMEALSIARYALDRGYRQKAESLNLMNNGKKVVLSKAIGVSMMTQSKAALGTRNKGYNFSFSENELVNVN